MNYNLISNIQFDGIDHKDAPDYSDSFITSAEYNGEVMTEEQIDQLDPNYVYEKLMEYLN